MTIGEIQRRALQPARLEIRMQRSQPVALKGSQVTHMAQVE